MVMPIGRGPTVQPRFEVSDVDEAMPVEAPPPPPPPPAADVPSGYDDEPSQARPLAASGGYSGKVDVTFEYEGRTEPVQLTAIDDVLSLDGREVGRVTGQRADGSLELELLGKPSTGRPAGPAPATVNQLDQQAYPSGRPESYVKTQFPATPGATADRQAMIDTVVSVAPPEQQDSLRALLEKGGDLANRQLDPGTDLVSTGVSDESLKKAFDAVLQARTSPGQKTLELNLVPQRTLLDPEQSGGDSGSSTRSQRTEDGTPVKLRLALSVDAQGKVNGAPLAVDELTRLNTELTKVAPDLKLEALRQAGVPAEFINTASAEQRDDALARLRAATLTPGEKTLTFAWDVTESAGDDSGASRTRRVEAPVTLKVDAQGNVDGKPLFIETAFATNRVMEQLPMAEKRAMLQRLGFTADDLRPLQADRATEILTKVALKTRTPGEHSLEVDTGPDKFIIALKVGNTGELEGANVAKLPPPKKKSLFQKIAGPLLTVASFVFPEFAPLIRVVQAGMAIAGGARGAGLVGAVLGGASGVAGLADLAGVAGAADVAVNLSSAAGVVNGVNGAVQSLRSGDLLGAFSSAISLAGAAGNLAKLPDFAIPQGLRTAGELAGIGSSVRSGDLGGAFAGVFGMAYEAHQREVRASGAAPTPATTRPPTPGPIDDDLGDGRTVPIEVSARPGVTPSTEDDLGDGRTLPIFVGTTPGAGATDDLGEGTQLLEPGERASPGAQPSDGSRINPADLEPTTTRVRNGDSLIRIAGRELGDPSRWPELYAYNRDILDNPNAIAAGAELKLPPPDFQLSREERNAILRGAVLAPPSASTPDSGGTSGTGGDSGDNDVGVREDLGQPMDPATAEDLSSRLRTASGEQVPHLKELAEYLKTNKDVLSLVPGGLDAVESLEAAVKSGKISAIKAVFENPGLVGAMADLAKDPTVQRFMGPLGKFLEIAGPVLSGAGAAFDTTNTTEVGRAYNVVSNVLIDVLVGKSNPVVAFADTVVGLIGKAAGSDDRFTLSKNLTGGIQSAIALMESVDPTTRSQVLDRIIKQNESGQNGAAIALLTNASQQYISPFVNDVIFGVMDYFKKDPAVVAAEARRARDTMRARVRQQGG